MKPLHNVVGRLEKLESIGLEIIVSWSANDMTDNQTLMG
jgi:hypothetical protein